MRGIIVAVSPNGVIGVAGALPWHYSGDLKRFKRVTLNTTVIMGRNTWMSLPIKPLPGRRNIVITSRPLAGVECYANVRSAVDQCPGAVWFIGGAKLYEEALNYCDIIDMTHVPDRIENAQAVYFPVLNPVEWKAGPVERHPDDPNLKHQVFKRQIPGH